MDSEGGMTVTVAGPVERAQRFAQPPAPVAPSQPPKPVLDAETVRLLTELGAKPGSIEMETIRAALTNGRDLVSIVEHIAAVAFRNERKMGDGWRMLCPALHEALKAAQFGASA